MMYLLVLSACLLSISMIHTMEDISLLEKYGYRPKQEIVEHRELEIRKLAEDAKKDEEVFLELVIFKYELSKMSYNELGNCLRNYYRHERSGPINGKTHKSAWVIQDCLSDDDIETFIRVKRSHLDQY